ncbi:unnamed protein product [Closterium sp. NIES-65]|nr:unnamed protein product [Closterium sp. NIES-65]
MTRFHLLQRFCRRGSRRDTRHSDVANGVWNRVIRAESTACSSAAATSASSTGGCSTIRINGCDGGAGLIGGSGPSRWDHRHQAGLLGSIRFDLLPRVESSDRESCHEPSTATSADPRQHRTASLIPSASCAASSTLEGPFPWNEATAEFSAPQFRFSAPPPFSASSASPLPPFRSAASPSSPPHLAFFRSASATSAFLPGSFAFSAAGFHSSATSANGAAIGGASGSNTSDESSSQNAASESVLSDVPLPSGADVSGAVLGDGAADVISAATSDLGVTVGSELAAAAAHCSAPIAALQQLIGAVHDVAGLPWWLSIAAATVGIRLILLPAFVYQVRSTVKMALIKPEMERLLNKVKAAVSRSALLLLSPPTSLLLSPPSSLFSPLSSSPPPLLLPISLPPLLRNALIKPRPVFLPNPLLITLITLITSCITGGYDTEAVAHYNGKMQALLKNLCFSSFPRQITIATPHLRTPSSHPYHLRHNTTPFAPLLGIFLQAPIFIGFYFAITGMAEHMPSFATGGAFWFTDLSTPDPTYLLPLMSSAGILAAVELNAAEGMEGAPNAAQMKWFMRGLAVTMVPLTVTFPKLKKQLSQTAIGVGAAGTLYCFLGISIQTAISYGIGSAASCLYLLLLFNDTDTIAPEDLPPAFLIDRNKPKRKGLVDSLATVDSPQKLLQGAQLALSSRRLAVPAALVLLWAFSVQFSGSDPNSLHIECLLVPAALVLLWAFSVQFSGSDPNSLHIESSAHCLLVLCSPSARPLLALCSPSARPLLALCSSSACPLLVLCSSPARPLLAF